MTKGKKYDIYINGFYKGIFKMNRKKRAKLAKTTLSIIENGFYLSPSGEKIDIKNFLSFTKKRTKLYEPDSYYKIFDNLTSGDSETEIEVTDETTLQASFRAIDQNKNSKVIALNFASAKSPGGGFLSGSEAQEETIARSSGLYPSLLTQKWYYDYHRQYKSPLYSDHIIYSPQVVVFRDDDGKLLNKPYLLNIVSSPAVNAAIVKKNEPESFDNIKNVMYERGKKVLAISSKYDGEILILGAWGCGVFQNDPQMIASVWNKLLKEEPLFKNRFKKVIFAIYDTTPDKKVFNIFKNTVV